MNSQTEVTGLKPADAIVVSIDNEQRVIRLRCDKHPDKCDKHQMKFKGMLHWRSAQQERFTIYFSPGRSPFDIDTLIYEQATTPRAVIHEGTFKYTVRDDKDPTNELDPEIVVDPPKGDE